jgi:hypothetical protein
MSAPAIPPPFRLRYSLTRSQRLIPHLRIWGSPTALFVVACFAFFIISIGASAAVRRGDGVLLFAFLALTLWWAFGGLFRGLLDVIRVPVREMDVIFEENAAGLLDGDRRWYLFLDGVTRISRFHPEVWTVQHHNGSVFHIPVTTITPEQLRYLQEMMEWGKTPEATQAVIERGRRLAAMDARSGGRSQDAG